MPNVWPLDQHGCLRCLRLGVGMTWIGEDEPVTIDLGFRALYLKEAPSVFRTVFLLTRDRAIAEDATQEAFVRALERWSRLRGQPWVGGWVTTTALNLARRGLRRRDPPERNPDVGNDLDETLDLWRGVARLPVRQLQAIVLYYREDRPIAEVAAIMGCREGTVRTHLARAYSALQDVLKEEGLDVARH